MSLPTIDQLNADQHDAVIKLHQFLDKRTDPATLNAIRLSGAPGTGKSTTLVISLLERMRNLPIEGEMASVLVTAPTNKATRQIRKMLTSVGVTFNTMTIYKALGLRLSENGEMKHIYQASNKPPFTDYPVVVVDEYSMINRKLMEIITNTAMTNSVKVIFLGDDDQLPPVKESRSVVSDLVTDFLELSKIERSGADSQIQATVKMVRDWIRHQSGVGGSPYHPTELLHIASTDSGGQYLLDPATWREQFEAQAKAAFLSGNMDQSRAIAYTNARVDTLNGIARRYIHGKDVPMFVKGETLIIASPVTTEDEPKETIFPTDEEVKIIDCVEGVMKDCAFTGDKWKTWELTVVDEEGHQAEILYVLHPDEYRRFEKEKGEIKKMCYADRSKWSKLFYPFSEQFHQVKHPYAITAHRSQGSTYGTVFMDLENVAGFKESGKLPIDMYLRLLYVGISRARYNVAFNRRVI